MKNIFLISGLLCWFGQIGFAQKELTLESSISERYTKFNPEGLNQLSWIKNENKWSFVTKDKDPALVSQGAETLDKKVLISLGELNTLLELEKPLPAFPRYDWLDNKSFTFISAQKLFSVNFTKKTFKILLEWPAEAKYLEFNAQKTSCAYIQDDNVFINQSDGQVAQITKDGGKGIVYGQSVHRSEFGITGGIFWSKDGSKLAFYRMDETMVTDYPLVDITSVPAKAELIKYPIAGGVSHEVTLGVVNNINSAPTYLKIDGPKDQYLTSIAWTPDANSLIVGVLNRDQNHLKVNKYGAISGELEMALFEEKHDKYVEPEHAPWFLPNSQSEFLWFSKRCGFQHLYAYNAEGDTPRQITRGDWEVHEILGFDASGQKLLVNGTGETINGGVFPNEDFNGTQLFTYQIDFSLGNHVLVDSTKGTHYSKLSSTGEYLLDQFTSVDTPLSVSVIELSSKGKRELISAEDPMEDYGISKPELFSTNADDGETLYGRIIKPADFDAKKKYPVLVYLYGGPHVQLITDSYLAAAPLWMYWFANQGYIVATIDGRGSANRGLDFEQTTFRNLGVYEMGDQMTLVNYLKSQTYVDGTRMGIHGWSYGGFMTINMMLTYPGLFNAGVAGGPVCDWSMYEVMYTERYMDTPKTNPEGYKHANLVERAKTLSDDLLIIHGTMDNVVVWQHSQAFLKSCIDNKIQLDYFVYPGHEHNVRGKDRVHLMKKVLTHIQEGIEGE
jgi:dipeptidyl-peptidase 4